MERLEKIRWLRMERQGLMNPVEEPAYDALYRDLQPGQNVYWNGFGQPPVLSERAAFDDIAYNRLRQRDHLLLKGRFAGGNLGWIVPEDLALFAALYRKPLTNPTLHQTVILELIEREGPLNIQQIKEETGLLVKEITPVLHRLQEAFLVYEDQYDGEWDRGWYRFGEMFPEVDVCQYSMEEALMLVLRRFAYRMVWFDVGMAKAFYRLPEKKIRGTAEMLVTAGELVACQGGWMLREDAVLLEAWEATPRLSVFALHRNDFLVRAYAPMLKEKAAIWTADLPYDCDPLQYLLIDGEFRGASVGHFRNGPYDLNDIVCDLPDAMDRREEIIRAIRDVNFGKMPSRFLGKQL